MHKIGSFLWLLVFVIAVFLVGCGNGDNKDTTAPTVKSVTPTNGTLGVSVSSIATATFSETMNPSSITTATFTLTDGAIPVPGTVTYAGTTATFTPAGNLATNTTFTATITTGVKDPSGNALASNYVWSFKTAFAPAIQYALAITATNGTVTQSPNQVSYDAGDVVTLTPVPAAGYHFTGWSGDLLGAVSPELITMTGDKNVTANFAVNAALTYSLTVVAVNGSVTKSPNQATYNTGTVVTLTATPAAGYHFTGWSGDLVGAASTDTITMNADKNVAANFAINTFTLTASAVNGSVTKSPSQATYNFGTSVTLTAVPAAGYHFTSWTGDLISAISPATISMTANKSVTANFAINPVNTYTLTTIAVHGSITKSLNQATYNSGTSVILTAVPAAGYHFTGWSGDLAGAVNPLSISMTANKTVTANFAINTYTLTLTAVNGSITKSPSQATYNSGTAVTLTAVPAVGYHFTGWSGDLTGVINPSQITVSGAKNITASFAINTYTLTLNAVNGSVTKSPSQATYNHGTSVTLTAVPSAGYHFTGWSGSLAGAVNPSSISMTSNKTVTANFAVNTYTLTTIDVNGSVTKSPSQATYNSGTTVTLTAVPSAGYHFTGWSGDLAGAVNPTTINMTENKTVTANFAINTYTLTTIDVNGNVTKSPSQATYNHGTSVTLTAVPAAGYHFTGWSGDLVSAVNPSTINMTTDKTITANFALDIVVTATPNTATIDIKTTQQFTATLIGTVNQTVTWTVVEGLAGGTINAAGLYSAPAVKGTYHVKATSVADPTKSDTSTLTVQSGNTTITVQ